ncbi:hypothetical protein [Allonocardiopsis opalescens]|uniref:Uncharacterized protein n=1 Tax=Allonocardiopsis opalescens TaxID=1144618 RepID=A0A2T0PPJ5_9ACTN|nr:hypothetical protein [Allonocardiopsis opalescens]PRX90821.1 hypothetical protein CLV72_11617 [Allonocardiopsis opalescens]
MFGTKKDDIEPVAEVPLTGGVLGRDQILSARDALTDYVDVPEWGGRVKIRSLSGTERDAFEAGIAGNGKKLRLENIRAKLVAKCAINEQGQQLFSTADTAALGRKNAAVLDRVFQACQKLSGITDEDVDELLGE